MNVIFILDDDPGAELRKQRGVIENLKQDRAHYREEAEKLRFVSYWTCVDEYIIVSDKIHIFAPRVVPSIY